MPPKQTDATEGRPQGEETGPARLPYEPPRLEVIELRPEEQLLQCTKTSQHHCRTGSRKHS